jgi:hypothetical protein
MRYNKDTCPTTRCRFTDPTAASNGGCGPISTKPPVTTTPGETKPETKPGDETKPATKPGDETKPATTIAGETKPATRPGEETKPATTIAGETKPATRPADETKPATRPAGETKPPCTDDSIKMEVRLSSSGGNSFASDAFRVGAKARAMKCDTVQDVTPNIVWTAEPALPTTVTLKGSLLSIPAGTVKPGSSYKLTATATHGTSRASTSGTFTFAARPCAIAVVGGATREVSADFGIAAEVKDPSGAVDSTLVAWTCAKECPAPLNKIANGQKVRFASVPAGKYTLTATYKGVSASSIITVVARPTLTVETIANTNDEHLASDSLRAYAAIKKPADGSTVAVQWYLADGTTKIDGQTSASLVLTPAQITKYAKDGKVELVCIATAGTVTGRSSFVMKIRTPITTAKCAVAHADSTVTGAYVGGESKLKITTSNWGETTGLTYKYSVMSEDGQRAVPLTTVPQAETSLRTGCPLARKTLKFVVVALLKGRPAGTATCSVDVAQPASLATVTKAQTTTMTEAAAAGDKTRTLEAALIASTAVEEDDSAAAGTTTTTATKMTRVEKKDARQKTIRAMKALFVKKAAAAGTTTTAADANAEADMSSEERTSLATILAANCRKAKSKPTTTVTRAPGSTAAPEEESLTEEEQNDVRDLVKRMLTFEKTDGGKTLKTEVLETATQAKPLLEIIATLKDSDRAENCRKLSKAIANNLKPGETQKDKTDDFAITAEKRPATDATKPVVADKSEITLSSDVISQIDAEDTDELSVATVEYTRPPVTIGADDKLVGDVTEFDVQRNGEDVAVTGLTKPITLKFTCTKDAADSGVEVRYHNPTTDTWTKEGIVDIKFDALTLQETSSTTHLSMFVAMSASNQGGDRAASNGDLGVGVIAGVAIGGVLIVGLAIGFLVSRKPKRHDDDDDENAEPLTELCRVPERMDHTRPHTVV